MLVAAPICQPVQGVILWRCVLINPARSLLAGRRSASGVRSAAVDRVDSIVRTRPRGRAGSRRWPLDTLSQGHGTPAALLP